MEPHIHARRIVCIAGVVEFLRKLFTCSETAVEIESFHQIDDGRPPGEFFTFCGCCFIDDSSYIDCLCGSTRRSNRWRTRCCCVGARRLRGAMTENCTHNISENTHDVPPRLLLAALLRYRLANG